jgi:hypothetical protein
LLTKPGEAWSGQPSRSRAMLLSADAWSAISAIALVFLVAYALVG